MYMHGRPFPRLALPALVAAAFLAAVPAASARRAPCIPGQKKPVCHVWNAKVGPVHDGDTFQARIAGSRKLQLVRMTGIQAMELDKYGRRAGRKGECNAIEATVALERMIRHRKIRLLALKPGSITGERGRLRRAVMVKQGGRWVDPGEVLLRKGLVLWFPNGQEWAWNRKYSTLAAETAAKGIGIWNATSCGEGPSQESPLSMKVKWDAAGQDSKNINGEFARITNLDPLNPVSLHRWWFRDSHLRPRVVFGRGAEIPAGGSIRVLVGRGRDTADTVHWNLTESVWENVVGGNRAMGDGGYLFDPQGDLRAFVQYPCRVDCSDPVRGNVSIRATFRGTEFVTLRNTSANSLDLGGYEISNSPWFYEFRPGVVLAPGQTLVLYVGKGANRSDAIVKEWGFRNPLLADGGDVVTLRNPLGAPVACHAWRRERCPSV